ncbi:MAG: hypothetical protein PHP73_07290 [Candidatus Omnitrophica bacterium]|nr:hypothetical protein [Candidatus Omnitrophota bacterium]
MKKIIFIPIFIFVAGILIWRLFSAMDIPAATNFNDCVAMGNPVTESYPRQCRTLEGEVFTENTPSPTPSPAIIPADSEFPAAGICAQGGTMGTISVQINQDIPMPRCQKVSAGDRLAIKNNTGKSLSAWFGKNKEYVFSISAQGEYALPKPVEKFLAPGVHILYASPYFGPEIWLTTDSISDKGNGTVKGKVGLGPTCPVVTDPPDPACADKPYKTTVQVIEIGSPKSAPVATAETNDQGMYTISLPAGEYGLQPIGGNPLPRCETKNVAIKPNTTQDVNLYCDTGIR